MTTPTAMLLTPLMLFAFASSITPGPNNLMLASSGLTYGFRRSLPHMLGISAGFMVMLVLVGLGLGVVFQQWPVLHDVLQIVCAVYLLYLAWCIAMAAPPSPGAQAEGRPFSFLQAAAFQWVNPKAWTMALGVVAVYVPPTGLLSDLLLAALLCGLVNLPSISVWTMFGVALRRLLHRPTMVRVFNWLMALLLVGSLYPIAAQWLS